MTTIPEAPQPDAGPTNPPPAETQTPPEITTLLHPNAVSILYEEDIVGSQEDVALYCIPCDREDVRLAAAGFCVNCEEHLCENCLNYHKKAKPSKHHVILNKEIMPMTRRGSNSRQSEPTLDIVRCKTHKEKMIEFYCPGHKAVLCQICSTLSDHATCKIDFIPDIATEYTNGPAFQQRTGKIETLITASDEKSKSALKREEENEAEMMAVIKEIDVFRCEINEALGLWEKQVKQTAEELKSSQKKNTKVVEMTSADVQKEIASLKAIFEGANDQKNCDRRFIDIVLAEQRLQELEKLVQSQTVESNVTNLAFIPNERVLQVFKGETALGGLTCEDEEVLLTPPTLQAEAAPPTLMSRLTPSRSSSKRSIRERLPFFQKREP